MSQRESEPVGAATPPARIDHSINGCTHDSTETPEWHARLRRYAEWPPLRSVVAQLLRIEDREGQRYARVCADQRHALGKAVSVVLSGGRPPTWTFVTDAAIPEDEALALAGIHSPPVPTGERLWVVIDDSGCVATYVVDVRQVMS